MPKYSIPYASQDYYRDPYTNTLVNLAREKGAIAGEGARRSGAIWGGLANSLGGIASGAITDLDTERKQKPIRDATLHGLELRNTGSQLSIDAAEAAKKRAAEASRNYGLMMETVSKGSAFADIDAMKFGSLFSDPKDGMEAMQTISSLQKAEQGDQAEAFKLIPSTARLLNGMGEEERAAAYPKIYEKLFKKAGVPWHPYNKDTWDRDYQMAIGMEDPDIQSYAPGTQILDKNQFKNAPPAGQTLGGMVTGQPPQEMTPPSMFPLPPGAAGPVQGSAPPPGQVPPQRGPVVSYTVPPKPGKEAEIAKLVEQGMSWVQASKKVETESRPDQRRDPLAQQMAWLRIEEAERKAAEAAAPLDVASNSSETSDGRRYVNLGEYSSQADKKKATDEAKAAGIPVLSAKDVGAVRQIETAKRNMAAVRAMLSGQLASNGITRPAVGLWNQVKKTFQLDPDIASYDDFLRITVIPSIQAMASGGTGNRINVQEILAQMKALPSTWDTAGTAAKKLKNIDSLFDNALAEYLGPSPGGGGGGEPIPAKPGETLLQYLERTGGR